MPRCNKAPNSATALCHVLLQLSRQPSTAASLENLFSEASSLPQQSCLNVSRPKLSTPKVYQVPCCRTPTLLACLLHSSDTSLGLSLLHLDWPWMTPSHSSLRKTSRNNNPYANLASYCCQVSAPTVNKDQSSLEPPPWCKARDKVKYFE